MNRPETRAEDPDSALRVSHPALEELLSEDIAAAIRREQTVFDQLAAPSGDRLVLFGAGNLGRKTLAGLRGIGRSPLAFADNDPAKWNENIDGVPVLAPAEAARSYANSATFVVTIWTGEGKDTMAERRKQLLDAGCRNVVPFPSLFWKYPDVFLPHYLWDLPHRVIEQSESIRRAYGLLTDEASRKEFVAQIRLRLLADFECLPAPTRERIYFPADLVTLSENDVLADCGAYDGDTIREFLEICGSSFRNILALEPDPQNWPRIQAYVRTLPGDVRHKITLLRKAAGAGNGILRFRQSGTASSAISADGDIAVEVVTLDGLTDLTHAKPTIVKMDIEGAELDALEGARGLVARARPVLAICAYHRQDHLWRVPLLIHSCSPDYSFSIRPHLLEGWDTVCYAIPGKR